MCTATNVYLAPFTYLPWKLVHYPKTVKYQYWLMKYVPKPPAIPLEEALKRVTPLKQYSISPSRYSLPSFHENVFVRLLAAKPKMDVLTKRIYPSTLLYKVGVSKSENSAPELKVMSPRSTFIGPRVWTTSDPRTDCFPRPALGKLLGDLSKTEKKSALNQKYEPLEVLLKDIADLHEIYKSSDPATSSLACTTHSRINGTPFFDITSHERLQELNLPDKIYANSAGLHLAGAIYKYIYVHTY